MQFPACFHLMLALAASALAAVAAAAAPPNIVLVITDDQGYGDLGHTGNPVVKTPHLDALAAESTSLTNYHVAPTCSPTRAALMTGHWTDRTGVWHTINGRSMLRENEVTLGQLLQNNGYATGMFGKWHLGDNYPYRPEDRGFTEVYRHGGGGVGQTPDLWDNAYFDGRYFHNGKIAPASGFCTDVFFREAQRFMREQAAAGKPFFAYISTNAPHGPLHCPKEYLDRYADQPAPLAAFYGMITNIDDNIGSTRRLLEDLGIADNTLFIFTTDNGTASGGKVFNAGMRGQKGSEYDGGHRVPFIAHWPAAGWNRRHSSNLLCHAVDVVPTLVALAGGVKPVELTWDGRSIRPLLDPAADPEWPDRMLVTDSQRVRDPVKWKQTAVMSQRWRLINGRELYDMDADPGQQRNLAADHPEQVAAMTAFYDAWWAELEPTFSQTTEIHLGHPDHPQVSLTGHDWIGPERGCPWNQGMIRAANGDRRHDGHWAVRVVTPGTYTFTVRRWPAEADHPITAPLPPGADVPGATKAFRTTPGKALAAVSATLRIDGTDLATKPVTATDTLVSFTAPLAVGSYRLSPVFTTAQGDEVGAYYCIVTPATAARPQPNIVFIFADDWGWGDLSCHGHPWLETPNLDRLASEGIDFAQFNVLNPVCSPSRAALMTGLYPARFSIHQHFATPAQNQSRNMPDWLDPQAVTLPRLLKQAGYRTGHFGKWHLTNRETHGAPKPEAYGYDEAAVFNGGAEWPSADLHATAPNAAAFIKANKDKPFFINVWLHESHTPHVPTKASMEKWKHLDEQKQVYAAVITDGDDAVGVILDALKEAGVEENTLVLFSSDNGPESTGAQKASDSKDGHTGSQGYGTYYSVGETGGLRGRKRSLFEGGVRVPFLVRWPSHAPAGMKNETTVVTAVDMLPTLCAAAGVTLPEGYASDGENLVDALSGKVVSRTRPIFWEWRGSAREPDWWPRLAVRDGDWKLALAKEPGRAELYRLSDDRGESRDRAAEHPEVVTRLAAMASAWAKTLPESPDEACISRSDRVRDPSRKQGVSALQGSGTPVGDSPAESR